MINDKITLALVSQLMNLLREADRFREDDLGEAAEIDMKNLLYLSLLVMPSIHWFSLDDRAFDPIYPGFPSPALVPPGQQLVEGN